MTPKNVLLITLYDVGGGDGTAESTGLLPLTMYNCTDDTFLHVLLCKCVN